MSKKKSKQNKRSVILDDDKYASSSDDDNSVQKNNVVERSVINKKLLNLNKGNEHSMFDSDDDNDTPIKISVNKEYEAKFNESKEKSALGNENQRMLRILSKQVLDAEKAERAEARKQRRVAKKKLRADKIAKGEIIESESESECSSDASNYSSEDETGSKFNDMDNEIFETLLMIRNKDPKIYKKDIKFFEDKTPAIEEERVSSEPKKKKMTIAQYMAGRDIDDLSESDDETNFKPNEGFYEQQKRLKQEFFTSLQQDAENKKTENDDDDEADNESDDDFFGKSRVVYDPSLEDDDMNDDEEVKEALADVQSARDTLKDIRKKEKKSVNTLTTKAIDDDLTDQAKFLQDYVMNEWWKEEDSSKVPTAETILGKARGNIITNNFDADGDDEFNDEVDRYEAEINFRYEEAGANEIMTFPRHIDGTLRKKETTRKLARERRLERKKLEKERKEEEIRRMKNITKKALQEKLAAISSLSGVNTADDDDENVENKLTWKDLEGDFDPEKYDKRMQAIFNDEFYGEDDVDMDSDDDDDDVKKNHKEKVKAMLSAQTAQDEAEAEQLRKEARDNLDKVKNNLTSKKNPNWSDSSDDDDDGEFDEDDELDLKEAEKNLSNVELITKTVVKKGIDNRKGVYGQVNQIIEAEQTNIDDQTTEANRWLTQEKKRVSDDKQYADRLEGLSKKEKEVEIKKIMQEEMEKLYSLDKEDVLADSKYHYMEVPSADYGLSIEDILNMTDKELNAKVSMKKLAPYREDVDDNRHWSKLMHEQKKIFKDYKLGLNNKTTVSSNVFKKEAKRARSNDWSKVVVNANGKKKNGSDKVKLDNKKPQKSRDNKSEKTQDSDVDKIIVKETKQVETKKIETKPTVTTTEKTVKSKKTGWINTGENVNKKRKFTEE